MPLPSTDKYKWASCVAQDVLNVAFPPEQDVWGVFEQRTGVLWTVTPPTRETAEEEARLAGLGHQAMTLAEGAKLRNVWAAGRCAQVRRDRGEQ